MNNYVKNYLGYTLSPEQMEDIPYPMTELMIHISAKTVESGIILGTIGGALGAVAKPATRSQAAIEQNIARFGLRGGLIGLALGPVVTIMAVKMKSVDKDGLYDRCYRLRHNRSQIRIDRATDLGVVSGAALSYMAGRGLVLGGVVGCTCGILTTTVLNAKGCFDK